MRNKLVFSEKKVGHKKESRPALKAYYSALVELRNVTGFSRRMHSYKGKVI